MNSTMDKLRAAIEQDIERCGRTIIGVFACEEGDMPFAYTIGNAIHAIRQAAGLLPELLVIGLAQAPFLNDLSQMMIDADAPFHDNQIVLMHGAEKPVKIIKPSDIARTEYAIQAGQFFGSENYQIMQVLLPDRAGKFPDDPGCQPPFSNIPILRLS